MSLTKKLLTTRHVHIFGALLIADAAVFSLIDPLHAPALWLITGYVLLGITVFAFAALLAQAFKAYGDTVYRVAWRFLRYSAAAAVIIVGLQSIGQLTTKDIIALLPFTVVAYWYFGYGKRRLQPASHK